ncbi:VanZ family protein [Neobacillus drentensis]|uniref:VanZ family protein n=1 Tax=Neobacillus drentensis TaxID=220684 RepID=UPI002859CB47|nr:VanZ family protein [Neobacillus drentensis]MDR7239956.1 VanZ family protein [Neobacillus drentensis]
MDYQQLQTSRINKKKTRKHILLLKILLIIFWGLFLLLNTWTESLEQLLDLQSVDFRWVSTPDFKSFFYFYDLTLVHPDYLKVKLGHFIGFAIMDILLFNLLKNHKYSIGISITFAFLTEFLQMFFGRDGRFYDLAIDSFGVLSVFIILKIAKI